MKVHGIMYKLWLAMLVLVVAVLGLTTLIQVGALEKIYYKQQEARLVREGEKLAQLIVGEEDPQLIIPQICLLARLMNASIIIFDDRGRIVHWQGRAMGMGNRRGELLRNKRVNPFIKEQVKKVLQGQNIVKREHNPFFDIEVLMAGIPIKYGSQIKGGLFIHAPLAPMAANLEALQKVSLCALVFGAFAATILSFLVSRTLTGPLIEMNKAAEAMADGDYNYRVNISSKDELGFLAESLNTLSKRLQEKIAALEKVDQNRREFVANVSHELRTPLTIIQGYIEAIQDGLVRQENQEEYLNVVLQEVMRLRRLVDDLLDLAKMEAGQVTLKEDLVDISYVTGKVIDKFSPVAKEKGITLKSCLEDKLPLITGDADRLEQVLTNLVDNGIRYTPPGGEVKITMSSEPGFICGAVSDTGPGIAEEDIPFIWERFYKGDRSRRRLGGGSGLGLAIARQIIELHGGTIQVESQPGKGTDFIFKIPVKGG